MSYDDEDDRPLRAIAWSRFKAWCGRIADRVRPRKPPPSSRAPSMTMAALNNMFKRRYNDEAVAAALDRPHPLFAAMKRASVPLTFVAAPPGVPVAPAIIPVLPQSAEADAADLLDGTMSHDEYKRRNRQRWEAMCASTIAEFDDEKIRESLRRSFARFDKEKSS